VIYIHLIEYEKERVFLFLFVEEEESRIALSRPVPSTTQTLIRFYKSYDTLILSWSEMLISTKVPKDFQRKCEILTLAMSPT